MNLHLRCLENLFARIDTLRFPPAHTPCCTAVTTAPRLPPPPLACRYCLEAHARAGMIVDTVAVKSALLRLLPHALAGEGVLQLAQRLPWPSSPHVGSSSGLYWEV